MIGSRKTPELSRGEPDYGLEPQFEAYHGVGELPRSPAEALEPGRGPEPPRGRRRHSGKDGGLRSYLLAANGALTFLLMGALVLGLVLSLIKFQFDKPGPLAHSVVIVIPKRESVNAIAERLKQEGVITDSWVFVASTLYFRVQDKLKAGEYEIPKRASLRQVLDTLVEGRSILYKVTIPEGLTSHQIVQILNRQEKLKGTVSEIPAEGSLMPDTYKFSRNTERQELVARMANAQRKFMRRLWQRRVGGLPFSTPQEAVTLASIVEKETSRADERERIAGVFINRLRKRMRLESDPTIIYGITLGKGPLGRRLLREDVKKTTAYNTYRIDGLPPTPICNPGRAAIEAVLNPARTRDLFFVADGTGGHAFARTFAEHKRNVAKWRKFRAGKARRPLVKAPGGDEAKGAVAGASPSATAGVTVTGPSPSAPGVITFAPPVVSPSTGGEVEVPTPSDIPLPGKTPGR